MCTGKWIGYNRYVVLNEQLDICMNSCPSLFNVLVLTDVQDVMSAASFGGSFDLVAKNNKNLKTAFLAQVVRSTIYSRIPLLKYLPFAPPVLSEDITVLMDEILAKRKARKGPAKRDILQIILDAHQADPISFSENRLRDELNLFM